MAKLEQITSLDGSVRDKERLTLRLPLDARAAAVPRPVPAAKDLKPHPATLLLIDGCDTLARLLLSPGGEVSR